MRFSRITCLAYWMIPDFHKGRVRALLAAAALLASVTVGVPRAANAAIETDPTALYATMRKAYDEGASMSWPFFSQVYYEATVFDAGRAYALFRPDDANYAQVAFLGVDIATQLHYNPLTNNDASAWYVVEAANYTLAHGDPARQTAARALLAKIDAAQADPKVLATQADADASANVAAQPKDGDARAALVVADIRAYELTHDAKFRSLALQHAADSQTPLERLPDPEFGRIFALATSAASEVGYGDAERTAARAIADRREHTPELRVIGRVSVVPRELRLTRTAPADEYFGNLKYSPIGVHNEVARVNKYLDVGWGSRMESDALQIDSAVEDWQKQYPHDTTLPAALLDDYKLLVRVDTDKTQAASRRVRSLLVVQYPTTKQAAQLTAS